MRIKLSFYFVVFLVYINQAQNFSMSHNLPSQANPNMGFETDFSITKSNIGSFAKFQCDLPYGFTASALDVKGGSFTYENQRVKIVWVSVPSESNFSFKLKFTPPVNALNECILAPKFYYLEGNTKKEFESKPHHIKINSVNNAVASNEPAIKTEDIQNSNTVSKEESKSGNNQPAINNPEIAKPSEVKTENSSGAKTSQNTSEIKANTSTTNKENNESTKVVSETNAKVSPSNENVNETSKNNNNGNNSSTKEPVSGTFDSKTSNNSNLGNSDSKSTNTAPVSSSKLFKVQIGAFSSSPSKSKFPGVNFIVSEEEGLFKALSGSFSSKSEAEAHLQSLKSKGVAGFIVAYQNGKRIKP